MQETKCQDAAGSRALVRDARDAQEFPQRRVVPRVLQRASRQRFRLAQFTMEERQDAGGRTSMRWHQVGLPALSKTNSPPIWRMSPGEASLPKLSALCTTHRQWLAPPSEEAERGKRTVMDDMTFPTMPPLRYSGLSPPISSVRLVMPSALYRCLSGSA